jgi:hypothetical protein
MRTVAKGTTRPEATKDGLLYTTEQLLTLDGREAVPAAEDGSTAAIGGVPSIKQEGLELGAARAEFVNHLLLPDGTIEDTAADMLANAREAVTTALTEGGDVVNAAAALRAIELHLAEARFLFVVDETLAPLIFFQCAVAGNPDVY